jgi:hypothetical protein
VAPRRPDPHAHHRRSPLLQRRAVLRGGVGGLGLVALGGLAAACSSEGETISEGVGAGPEQALQALFPRDVAFLAAEAPSRLPYTLVDAEGVPFATIDEPVSFTISFDGEQVGDPVEVEPHSDGVPRPYLPLYTTFPRPGLFDIDARDGDSTLNSQVQVHLAAEVGQPLVGTVLPPASTPTPGQTFDVDPICTRAPQCPFHEVDLTTALGTGRPVVVLLATPAYCQTAACGPILDLLVEQAGGRDDLIVIHAEVYKNPKGVADLSQADLAPLPATYDMFWEPSLFVTDAANTIVARGDIVVDRGEMAEMLALAV